MVILRLFTSNWICAYELLGPNAHAVCYLLKAASLYNIVLLCPDNLPPHTNIAPANLDEMRALFKAWDPRLRALLDIATIETQDIPAAHSRGSQISHMPALKVQKWRLQNSRELPSWTHTSGTFTLLGDACHATLPYLAQGAAMAVEDAHVLGLLIGRMRDKRQLADILRMYEDIRKPRTTKLVLASTHQQSVLHMRDGEGQRERDRWMLEFEGRMPGGKMWLEDGRWGYGSQDGGRGFCNKWADGEFRAFLFGYEGEVVVEKAWRRYVKGGRWRGREKGGEEGGRRKRGARRGGKERGEWRKGEVLGVRARL